MKYTVSTDRSTSMLDTRMQLLRTSATLEGSSLLSGGGVLEVFTAQNRHARVHSSPMSIIVAVAVPFCGIQVVMPRNRNCVRQR